MLLIAVIKKSKVPGLHHRLNAGSDAELLADAPQIGFDGPWRNAQNFTDVSRALTLLCPREAFQLARTRSLTIGLLIAAVWTKSGCRSLQVHWVTRYAS